MNITLRQLAYLTALAEHRHFGMAAASVNITQSALSQQIMELESQLGTRLVERQSRNIKLTAIGRDVVERARQVLAGVRDIEQVTRWNDATPAQLNIGLIPTIAPYLLPHALPILRSENILLGLGVREAQTGVLLKELAEGHLDAVVIALPADADGMVEVPIMRDRFYLAGSKGPLAALTKSGLHPEQIEPDKLLLLDDGHCLADQALAACKIKPTARVDLRASSLTTLCKLAAEGFGFTLLPEIARATETRAAPDLQTKRFDGEEPYRTIGLVRRALTEDVPWFDVLADAFRRAGQVALGS